MEYFDFKKELLESSISTNKKYLRGSYIWFSFVFSLFILNFYFMIKSNHTCVTDIAVGINFIASLIIYLNTWDLRQEIKYDKEHLLKIEQYNNDELLKGAIKQHERAKEYYDDYIIAHSANSACHENKQPESMSPEVEN